MYSELTFAAFSFNKYLSAYSYQYQYQRQYENSSNNSDLKSVLPLPLQRKTLKELKDKLNQNKNQNDYVFWQQYYQQSLLSQTSNYECSFKALNSYDDQNMMSQQNIFSSQKFNVCNAVRSQSVYHRHDFKYENNIKQVYADLYAYYYENYHSQKQQHSKNAVNKEKSMQ